MIQFNFNVILSTFKGKLLKDHHYGEARMKFIIKGECWTVKYLFFILW